MITDESKRYFVYNLPLIKGFCILAVITIHTTARFSTMTQEGGLYFTLAFMNSLSQFAVPLFITISGFYLSLNPRNEKALPLYRRTIRFLIIPYIFYSIFYSILGVTQGNNPLRILADLPLAMSSYHMWFGLVIIQLYLLHPFIHRLFSKYKNTLAILIIAFLLQIFWQSQANDISQNVLNYLSQELFLISPSFLDVLNLGVKQFNKIIFLGSIGYFIGGYYLLEYSNEVGRLFRTPKLGLLCFILWILISILLTSNHIISLFDDNLYSIIWNSFIPLLSFSALSAILVLTKFQGRLHSFLLSIFHNFGLYSYGIYYLHVFFLFLFNISVSNFITTNPDNFVSFYLAKFFIVSLVTLLVVKNLARLPYAKYFT